MKKGYLSLAILIGLTLSVSGVSAKMTKEAHQYYQQASVCEYKQDMLGAIKLVQKAIEVNNDDDVMLYTKLGGLYSNVEQYQNAITAYKKAAELRPNDAFIYVSLGSIYQTIGDNANAMTAYNKALELCPEYKYNYINVANVALAQKNYNEAEEYFNKFLELYPDNDEAKANLAEAYFMNNKADKACALFKSMYEKNPDGFKEYAKYGTALYKQKEYKEAIPILEKAVEQDENSVKSLAQLALCYQNSDDFPNAERVYAKMFSIAPGMNEFRLDYANMLSAQSKDKEAIKEYNEYIKAYPKDADGYVNLGALYKRTDKIDLAIANFEKAYEIEPTDMDTVKDLAFCYHKKCDYDKAIKYYDIAIAKDPNNYSLNYNRAITLHAQEKYPEAIASYEKVLTLKNDETIRTNLNAALIEYGFKLLDENKLDDARANFNKAIAMNPKEPSAYFGMALTYENDKKEEALSYFQKAVDLDPANQEYVNVYENFKNTLSTTDLEKMAWNKLRDLQELFDKRVLIIGCGSVGTECAKRFKAFGCEVVGVDVIPRMDENYSCMVGLEMLDEQLADADVIVLTLPLTYETRGLIDGKRLSLIKKNGILVNIARGAIINQKALEEWEGIAILDVFEDEPLNRSSSLWKAENFLLTPHNSFVGEYNINRLNKVIINNLMAIS